MRLPYWLMALRALALTVALLFFTLPILWMVATAFKSTAEFSSLSSPFWPQQWTLTHLKSLLNNGVGARLFNTLWVAAGATALSLLAGFLAAYTLARHRFPARLDSLFLLLVLLIKMMPPMVVALPLYSLLKSLHLLNSLTGLMLAYQVYTLPFCIWMLLSFIRDVPLSLEEAAAMDGAGLWRRLRYIVLPVCAPGLVATAIFTLIMAWNEFLFALLFLQTPQQFTLPLFIANFMTENQIYWGELMGIGLLSSLPVLLVAGFVQRYLLRGFAVSQK
ncbi:carbohydrate ABC transporter permease [Dickeya solani]|uniref:Carbohydrate ABC transporter permease n=1 Tax=Dickeya solani TaxID=1089444 RepID=A0ABU4EF01_9GAMM|nr:carbohydrate ABC transporter permease [Dickeya solani]MCA6997587.1 carbohydrate ABC transporter permease [Dickeya solani]MCZ0819970.1 carbohydrate ABC transporter permease [Dickeya solani]MDV6994173.1 carbohydrate ABC transporter permease [Dickeya solani]MDV7004866.1 carbohydrate ABC transporter permease [Dickeya solani]MDV7039236.1 carbohydrate ABC transporter permease [Dickeya solani]